MNQRILKLTRIAAAVAALTPTGLLVPSCHHNYKNTPPSLILLDQQRGHTSAAGEAAPPPQAQRSPASGRESAVLFVAYATTPSDVVERMLKLASTAKNDVVYDLGCGDGRIVVTAAKKYGCRAVGYDLDPLRVQEARANVEKSRVAHLVTIAQQDVLKADFQQATVVMLYLGSEINARLIPQLRKLRPGARIVSHEFGLGRIPPDKMVEMTSRVDRQKHTLYLWTCPLAASGN